MDQTCSTNRTKGKLIKHFGRKNLKERFRRTSSLRENVIKINLNKWVIPTYCTVTRVSSEHKDEAPDSVKTGNLRHWVLMATNMKMAVFWDVAPYRW
jgi:hypothetical protein